MGREGGRSRVTGCSAGFASPEQPMSVLLVLHLLSDQLFEPGVHLALSVAAGFLADTTPVGAHGFERHLKLFADLAARQAEVVEHEHRRFPEGEIAPSLDQVDRDVGRDLLAPNNAETSGEDAAHARSPA